ncbi:ABC-2 family transporter protein, partial [Streptobacillus moniliformis]|uniref:ABC-2 family transporter protein n=1 Tax=Streptobacillus moniliformis TaxID=34105 RepID=UPI000ACFD4E4
ISNKYFNPVISFLFKSIIPIAWIGYIPAYINLKDNGYNLLLLFCISISISIIYFIIVFLIWNRALKEYSSSGT